MHQSMLLAALTAALAAVPAHAGLYPKSSPVLQVDGRSYDKLISYSNYTSIVEFYAPWCGHCQNLKPAFEKAATKLDGYAKVAAVDCDDDANKQLCGAMGIQGFPTLKTVRPGKKTGKPIVEDYQGPRTATGIVEDVLGKINNHVTRVADKELDGFLEGDKPKAILFSDKGTTSALLKSIAISYLDVISVGQIRNKETAAVEKFGIDSFPTFVLVPGPGQDPIVYKGELNKKDMVDFLKQAAEPNPDVAPAKSKSDKKKSKAKEEEKPPAEPEEAPEDSIVEETPAAPTPSIIPINSIVDADMLSKECLRRTSHTCILALVPAEESENGAKAVDSLSQLSTKYIHGKRHIFPFFSLPSDVSGSSTLREKLELPQDVEIVAVNARRGWWRHYAGDFSTDSVEAWVDAIRLGEGEKKKLPAGIVEEEEAATEKEEEKKQEEEGETQATDPEPEIETEAPEVVEEPEEVPVEEKTEDHDEL